MNGRERVIEVLKGNIPDRIPHFEWSIAGKVALEAHVWPKFGWSYPDIVDLLDIDAVVAWPLYETKSIGRGFVKDELGIVRSAGSEEYSLSMDEYAPLGDARDLSRFKFPPEDRDIRWMQLRSFVERFKGEKAIVMKLRDVFSWPRELRGYENIMTDMILNKDVVIELASKSADYCKKQAEIAVELGAEVIVTADDLGSNTGLMFSPRIFREVFLPPYKEIVRHVKKLGAFVIKHSDGNISEIVEDLIDAGVDCLDPIDPGSGMDLRGMKERYGKRVCLKGNVSCVGVLEGQDRSKVVAATKRCISDGAKGGRYILSSSNSIHSGVCFESYVAMIETLREFGTY